MEDVLKCLTKGDFVMGGENHNSHGCMVTFPNESPFPNMPKNVGEDRRFMAMPAYIGGPFDMAGMKWYGSNTANKEIGLPRSILMVMLNDKTTGAPVCLMSGNLLSAYRTGAIPGVGLRHLAPKGAKTGAIYGPGVMGKTSLDAFMATCPELDTLKVKGRGKKSLDSFLEYVKATYPQLTTVTVVDDIETLVRDSDVISFAATAGTDPSKYAYVKGEWIKPGALIVAPSAFDMETDFLKEKCKKVVDNIKLYEAWAEEYPYPTFGSINIIGAKFTDMCHDGIISKSDITDMGDILLGNASGRDSDDQIIIYSVGGMPVEDVAWGKVCYENAVKKWTFKGMDGMKHVAAFLTKSEPQVIQAHEASSEVIMNNCIRCHTQLNTEFVKTGKIDYMMSQVGEGKACWDCHRDVPHGGKNSLSGTPGAIVPLPESPVPEWLRKMVNQKDK